MNLLKRLSLWVLPVALALAVMPTLAARQDSQKTIYVSVLDENNNPITDLKPDELGVFEGGVQRAVVSAKPATSPMSILMLGDTSKVAGGGGVDQKKSASAAGEMIRDIRAAFSEFSKDILAGSPQSEIGLMEFGQASIMITKFTSKQADIEKGITRLFPKPDADSVLLEAILEGAKELSKLKNERRAMLSINVEPGNEASREPPNNILKGLAQSRAPLFSISLQKGDLRDQRRGIVLPQLAEQTGGRHQIIVGQSALVGLAKGVAAALLGQYEITYTRPAGPMPPGIQVGAKRAGKIMILASRFPPQ